MGSHNLVSCMFLTAALLLLSCVVVDSTLTSVQYAFIALLLRQRIVRHIL